MPVKPIIAIDVDSTQFSEFYKLFNQYRDKLSSLPEEWKSANDVMNAGLAAIAEQAHNINKNLHTAITSQHQFAKATSVSANGMKTMAKYAKETYEHIFNMGKFVLKAGAWGTGLFAGAAFGLDKLATSAINTTTNARGFNIGTGQLQSWMSAMRGLPGVQDLAGAQAAQSTPDLMGWLGMATGQSINAATYESPIQFRAHQFQVAHRLAQSLGMNPERIALSGQGMALEKTGMSMQDILRAGNTTQEEFSQRMQRYRQNIQDLAIQKKAYAGLLEFQTKLGNAGRALETDLSNKLGKLGGPLGSLVHALGEDAQALINDVLTPANLKAAQDAIGDFTKYLASGQAKTDIKNFVSGVETMASVIIAAVHKIEQWTGIKPPGTKAPGAPSGPRENFTFNADRQAQMEQVRRAYKGNTFLADFGSWQTLSDQIGASPGVTKIRGMAESKYGLLPGTLRADASAESSNYLFAVNGNMAGWYQMSPAARKDYGVANPYDPLSSSVGEAAQLASNLALARKLNPMGTMLQHTVMQKAANILGNGGFTKFWRGEQAAHRTDDFRVWQRDLPKEDQADIRRFVGALPKNVFRQLLADDRAGQIDTGGGKTLKTIASTLLRIEKNTGRTQPPQRDRSTPVYQSVPLASNAAR